jgi:hypothetical protein
METFLIGQIKCIFRVEVTKVNIRYTTTQDLEKVMTIYAYARIQMKKNGNPNQWGDFRPSVQTIKTDINRHNSFLITEDDEICGVFTFMIGKDPTYAIIENGNWLNDEPYGVIHRIASNGRCNGIMDFVLNYCESHNIRIDTHKDNTIMQHILESHHYTKCGTIYVDDGTPRIAYQKAAD